MPQYIAGAFVGLAAVASQGAGLEPAARLLGAADAIIDAVGISLETFELQLFEGVERTLATSDASAALSTARAEAHTWPQELAVAYALEVDVAELR